MAENKTTDSNDCIKKNTSDGRKRTEMELPGLKVMRQDLLVHVPSGKIIICRQEEEMRNDNSLSALSAVLRFIHNIGNRPNTYKWEKKVVFYNQCENMSTAISTY